MRIIILTILNLIFTIIISAQGDGNALKFDGIDDYVFVGNDASLNVNQFTLTAWINPTSYDNLPEDTRMEILEKTDEYWMNVSKVNGTQNRERGTLRVGGFFGDNNDGKGQWRYVDSKYVVPLSSWTHVACTYDYDSLIIFINGLKEEGIPIPENFTAIKNHSLSLGCKYNRDNEVEAQFHGLIDEITIWDTALTEFEIQDLMYESVRCSYLSLENLLAHYKFNEDLLGSFEGIVLDGKGLNNGENRGAEWVANNLTSIAGNGLKIAADYHLFQNYPNPFNPTTTISYIMEKEGYVRIEVYDIIGRELAVLVDERKSKGKYMVNLDAANLPNNRESLTSGVYFYKFTINDYVETKKMILLR